MAVLLTSALRAVGTTNVDFRVPPQARGLILTANNTAKGAGASTLQLTLQYWDEASGTYVALQDAEATQVAVTTGATAVAPTDQFVLAVFKGGASSVVPAAGKRRTFVAPLPSGSLRCLYIVAADTVTGTLSVKSIY